MSSISFIVGNAKITRIKELNWTGIDIDTLYPSVKENPTAVASRSKLTLSVHAWLVQTPDKNLLIDTGVGNHKHRPSDIFNDLNTNFLEQLTEQGVSPEDIDYVLLTHLHVDHVGWNTVRDGEK